MRVEIVTIGNELLNGDLADTNTARLSGWLRQRGLSVSRGQTVPDELDAIAQALALAASRADLVLVSGGMGPTTDDITMEAAARLCGEPLVEDAPTLARLRERIASRGFRIAPNNARQALVPASAAALVNPVGTAPCVRLTHEGATFFFFPGVPRELERLVADHLAPWLEERSGARPYRSRIFLTFGRPESQIASLIEPLPRDPRIHIAYRAHFPSIQISLHAHEPDEVAARALLDEAGAAVRAALGDLVYSEEPAPSIASAVARALTERGQTLALAESCTGGLVAKLCTDLPGASAWLVEGVVTYSNDAKIRRLGVPEALLTEHGAVSEAVARAMAEGVRAGSGATYGLAITGIAGPSGGTADKPVGTVHFALAGPEGTTHRRRRLPFGRERNRLLAAWIALELLRRAAEAPR